MAKVKIKRVEEGGTASQIHVHGMNTPIRFDKNGEASVEQSDWDKWVEPVASKQGITKLASSPKKTK